MGISTRTPGAGTLYFVALLREQLGQRIKTARVDAGLTQRELADRIHLKNATDVSRYERGKIEVPSHRIDLIATATGRPRSYFVRDPSEPEPADDDLREQVVETRQMVELILRHLGIEVPRSAREPREERAAS